MRLFGLKISSLGLLFCSLLAAQIRAGESSWFVRDWQTDEGLPNNTVVGIVQTPDGFLWLGTPTGLVRFDGIHFQEFSPTNLVAPPNRGILRMIGSRDGGLRLAMDRGAILLVNGNGVRMFRPGESPEGVPDETPYLLLEDAEDALWVTYSSGTNPVCRIKDGIVKRFNVDDGLPTPHAPCALAVDRAGRIWFGRGEVFGEFRDGRFHALRKLEANITRLASSQDGGIWIGAGARLLKFRNDGQLQDFGEYTTMNAGGGPTCLIEDRAGTVWVGTAYNGLFHYDGQRFEALQTTRQEIRGLTEDLEGNLWAGTSGGGLNRIRTRTVVLEGTDAGLPFETVQSLCEDKVGVLWAATQNGSMARRVGGHWQKFSPGKDWKEVVTCVTADPSGCLWIGTRTHGLHCWKDDRLVSWGNTNALAGQSIHTLLVSRIGDLWIGMENTNAVQRLRAGVLSTIASPPDEDLRVVRAMTEDANGSVWVGTSRGLLMRAEGDRLINQSGDAASSPLSIRCLSASSDGSVWIGYAGWGVGRFKDGELTVVGTDQGLLDDYVSHIVPDERGWLWFGGDRGLFKLRQAEFDELAAGHLARVRSIHFGRGEGLPSMQATFGAAPAALRSLDGRLWIPMRTGLAVVYPDRHPGKTTSPRVVLHEVKVDDSTVASYGGVVPRPPGSRSLALGHGQTTEPLRLAPGHRRVLFAYSALSYSAPENIQFRYRLDGLNEDWEEGEGKRSAEYTRLSAGTYTFHVMACNSEGAWSEQGAKLSFEVLPFFWQTWWFRSFVLAAFTLSVVAVVHYVSVSRLHQQMRQLEQQAALHKERARIAKDIHDDLGASLTQIGLLGELARQDRSEPDKAVHHLEKISGIARQILKSLDEIVWAVNPRNDTLAHLIDYAGQFAVDYLRVAGVRCRLDLPANVPDRELSTDVRHNLFLLVKESIHNVVKHAHASEVWLRVALTETHLRLAIEDNGCGFAQPTQSPGADGLHNLRQRIADIGGDCHIESQPGAGTKVKVELPWPTAWLRS